MQMLALEAAWGDMSRTWVTLPAADTRTLLAGETTVFGHSPTNRNVPNLVRNFLLAIRVVRTERPDVILSTGAGVAVPFFVVGKLLGARLVYVESVTRTARLSLTGRLLYRLCSRFFVQWPEAISRPGMTFAGRVM
jgi:UDP-N-acetylglucosamine:LPS N-acetylglucosamine transferase